MMNLSSLVDQLTELLAAAKVAAQRAELHDSDCRKLTKQAKELLNSHVDWAKLKVLRGRRPQRWIAMQAVATQTVISRIEAGDHENVSLEAMQRILQVYSKLEDPDVD